MGSPWMDKSEIERDLYLAQGRAVPIDIESLAGHRPLASNVIEETYDDYFVNCVPEEEYESGPDLTLITQMLDMMRELNAPSDLENEQLENGLEISKLNPVPNTNGVPKSDCSETCATSGFNIIKLNAEKCKMKRNVAVTSILEALKTNNDSQNQNSNIEPETTPKPLTLLKPNDMINDDDIAFANEFDNLKINENTKDNTKAGGEESVVPVIAPVSMFRRKKNPIKKSPEIVPVVSPPLVQYDKQFVPSEMADEYYKTYLERTKSEEVIENNIWAKVQKQIEAIQAQREKTKSKNSKQGESGDEEFIINDCL